MNIDKKNWFERIRYFETTIISQYSLFVDRVESLRGIAILLRNLSLISFIIVVYGTLQGFRFQLLLPTLLLGMFLLYVSAVVSFYFHVQILFWSFTLPRTQVKTG